MTFKKGQSGNPKGAPKGLTAMQRRFVAEYLIDMNATQAATRAGYKQGKQHGHDTLNKPWVRELVDAELAKRAASCGVTAKRVLDELAAIAFADLRQLFDDAGNLKPVNELAETIARAISGIDVTRSRTWSRKNGESVSEHIHKVRSWDKPRALELLAKHLGMLKDSVEHSGEITLPTRMVDEFHKD